MPGINRVIAKPDILDSNLRSPYLRITVTGQSMLSTNFQAFKKLSLALQDSKLEIEGKSRIFRLFFINMTSLPGYSYNLGELRKGYCIGS